MAAAPAVATAGEAAASGPTVSLDYCIYLHNVKHVFGRIGANCQGYKVLFQANSWLQKNELTETLHFEEDSSL